MEADPDEELRNFFVSHFHEDWREDADDPDAAVAAFVATRPSPELLRHLARDIQLFASRHPQDPDLEEALFKELWCFYVPSVDNKSAHTWLLSLAAKLLVEADKI